MNAAGIREIYDSGKWRRALQELEALGEKGLQDPELLALFIKCRAALAERNGLEIRFRALLAMPAADPTTVGDLYASIGEGAQLAVGPDLVRFVEQRGLTGDAAQSALAYLHLSLWPADRLFAAIAAASQVYEYDRYLAAANARFAGDPRLAAVKTRPPDPAELRRQQVEAKNARSKKAAVRVAEERTRLKKLARRNPELEAAILAHPEDVQTYRIYGDWLQEQRDPRGELIAMQAERLLRPDDTKLAAAEKKLLKKLRPGLLGELAGLKTVQARHRLGFLESIRIAAEYDHSTAGEQLEWLLKLDDQRFLRELTVGVPILDDNADFADVIPALAANAAELPLLHTLFLGDFTSDECELSWSEMGNVAPLYSAFPRLRSLKLRAGSMDLGKIELPELTHFAIETGGLAVASLESVVAATWPKLESLSLWFGSAEYGGDCGVQDVEPLLKNPPKGVRHLGLMNASITDELVRGLVESPILRQLESLDLSLGCLTEAGASLLIEHRHKFRHLRSLNLSNNCLEERDVERLRDFSPGIALEHQEPQRAEGDGRYPSVGE